MNFGNPSLNIKLITATALAGFLSAVSLSSAQAEGAIAETPQKTVHEVDPSHFFKETLTETLVKEERVLADGTKTLCYIIKTKSEPQEHKMGPWCPKTTGDDASKGGIWMEGGKIHDVDGKFITDLAKFYSDKKWNLYREDGSVRVTDTKEAFEAAERPDVDPRYQNYCVEGRPEWYDNEVTTYVIPVTPIYRETITRLGRGGVGFAFNGVNFDPPAPTHAILAAHTLAPLDDNGGHFNPHAGYHYHAATGKTKEITQEDGHAPMIGYALDGFGIYALLDTNENEPVDLDDARGHYDSVRGYHYHVGSAGSNQIIGGFHGVPGSMQVGDKKSTDGPGPGHGPKSGRDHGHPHPKGHGPPPERR